MPIPSDTSGLWWLKPDNNWLANAQITAHAMDRTMNMMQQKQQFEQEMQLRMAQFGLQQKKANMDMQLDAIKIKEANDEMDDMPKVAEYMAELERGNFEVPFTGLKSIKAMQMLETARNNKKLNDRVLGERNKFVNDLNNLPEDDFQTVADHLQIEGIDPTNIPLNAVIPQAARMALNQGKENAEMAKEARRIRLYQQTTGATWQMRTDAQIERDMLKAQTQLERDERRYESQRERDQQKYDLMLRNKIDPSVIEAEKQKDENHYKAMWANRPDMSKPATQQQISLLNTRIRAVKAAMDEARAAGDDATVEMYRSQYDQLVTESAVLYRRLQKAGQAPAATNTVATQPTLETQAPQNSANDPLGLFK